MLFSNSIFFVEENYFRLVNRRFFTVKETETHYRQAIAWLPQVRGRAIELNRTCIPNSVNDVGFELLAIRKVTH